MDKRRWLYLLALIIFGGCVHPSGFRPARTLEKGSFEHSVGLQASARMVATAGSDSLLRERRDSRSYQRPFTPTYALRYGLSERLEIGAQAGVVHFRGEATWGVIRSRNLDLALGLDLGILTSPILHEDLHSHWLWGARLSAATPIAVEFRPIRWLSFVGHAGPAIAGGAWAAQVGGGIDFSGVPGISIRPHASILYADEDELTYFTKRNWIPHAVFGLDLAFGGRR